MNEFELTSGRLTSLARLLLFLDKYPQIGADIGCEHLVRSRQIQTENLAREARQLAIQLRLLTPENESLKLSSAGKAIVLGEVDQYGIELQRRLLLKILTSLRRDLLWIAFAKPIELRNKLPAIFQILNELRLIDTKPGDGAIQFWEDLKTAEVKFNEAILKKIGDQAESWSMIFEKKRLIDAGYKKLSSEIYWVSRESDLHGYDILSFTGEGINPTERKHIEVKRAKNFKPGFLQFFLSRNEYLQSLTLGENYWFHLWKFDATKSFPDLFIVKGSEIQSLTPANFDADNYWTECLITFETSRSGERILGENLFSDSNFLLI